jgi:ATP-dependent helicase/DNAse subunit B
MRSYQTQFKKLKELKIEIEHLQHLLDQGKNRIKRDFESFRELRPQSNSTVSTADHQAKECETKEDKEEVYQIRRTQKQKEEDAGVGRHIKSLGKESVTDNIRAFYRARDHILEKLN